MKTKVQGIFQNNYFRVLFAVLATLLWGSAFPAVKIGYQIFDIAKQDTFGQILFAGYRFFLAGLIIFLLVLLSKQSIKLPKGSFKDVLSLGLLTTTFQYTFFYIGLSNTSGVKGAVLNSTSVFFTLVLAHFLLSNDKINKGKIFGLILGFAGVIIINYSPELLAFSFSFAGEGSMLISQFSGALGAIYLKRISGPKTSVILLTSYQMMLGSLILVFAGVVKRGFWPFELSSQALLLLLYLALLSAMAFSLWNTLIKYNAVGQIALYKFLIPVFGVLLSGLLLPGESIDLQILLALAIVSLGIITVHKGNNSSVTKTEKSNNKEG